MFKSGPVKELSELGQTLCDKVREDTIDVNDADNQWFREFERVTKGSSFLKKFISWATSGIIQFVVSLLGVVVSLVGIAVGLKKLQEVSGRR